MLVTTPIFQKMLSRLGTKLLVYGPFGTSKSTSFILYQLLSGHINSYLWKANEEDREDFKSNYEPYIPNKLFYYSVDLKKE